VETCTLELPRISKRTDLAKQELIIGPFRCSFCCLLFCSGGAADLVETCTSPEVNVGSLAYSPLTGGPLSGKYLDPESEAAKKGRFKTFPGYQGRYISQLALVSREQLPNPFFVLCLTSVANNFCCKRSAQTWVCERAIENRSPHFLSKNSWRSRDRYIVCGSRPIKILSGQRPQVRIVCHFTYIVLFIGLAGELKFDSLVSFSAEGSHASLNHVSTQRPFCHYQWELS
jgi:hypothetical protein